MQHSQIPEQEVAQYWDKNAGLWANHVRQGWDAYREFFNNPAFFEFIGDLSGKTVLDAGCGEGYNTRLLARSGARMTGVDISERMIELARQEEQREALGHRYENTYCPGCGELLIRRWGLSVSQNRLEDKECPQCGRAISVVTGAAGRLR